jgi:hypothetical protein
VQDEDGIIYSLRATAYVGQGSDDEKLDFLKNCATVDYLVTPVFPIPGAFHIRVGGTGQSQPVAYRPALAAPASPIAVFEEAVKALNDDLPAQTDLQIPACPLVYMTNLIGDERGNIRPVIDTARRF